MVDPYQIPDCASGHDYICLKPDCDHRAEYGLTGDAMECWRCRRVWHAWKQQWTATSHNYTTNSQAIGVERATCPIYDRWAAQGGMRANVP